MTPLRRSAITMRARLVSIVIIAFAATPARADRRNFPFTYEAITLDKGQAEIEQYLTTKAMRLGKRDFVLDWHYQLEVEYGIHNRFDVGIYQMFARPADGTIDWQGYKVRGRWRPVDYNVWPIDMLVYLEWLQLADGAFGFEEKLVFGKRTQHFNAAINLTAEQMSLNRPEPEIEFAPSLAVGFIPKNWITIGAEGLAALEWKLTSGGAVMATPAFYAGPTLALAGSRAWIAVSNLWQIGDGARDMFRVRLLFGITL